MTKSLSETTGLVLSQEVLLVPSQFRESPHLSFALLRTTPTTALGTDDQMSSTWTDFLRAGHKHQPRTDEHLPFQHSLSGVCGSAPQDGLLPLRLEPIPMTITGSELILPITQAKTSGLSTTVEVDRGRRRTIRLGSGNRTIIGALPTGGSLNGTRCPRGTALTGKHVRNVNSGSRGRGNSTELRIHLLRPLLLLPIVPPTIRGL